MKFNKGDIVKIRKDCTIEELNANHSNGCRIGTFKFLEKSVYGEKETYKIQDVIEDGSACVRIEDFLVNVRCLELVRRNKNKIFKNAKNNKHKDLKNLKDLEEFEKRLIDFLIEGK